MKAVVMEKKWGMAVVLKEDGSFTRIFTSARPAEEINLKEKRYGGSLSMRGAFASLALLLITVFSLNYLTVETYAYVAIDSDSSIEISLNRLNRVVSVKALNEESEELASLLNVSINGQSYEQALHTARVALKEETSSKDDDHVQISISSDSQKGREKLKEKTETIFGGEDDRISVYDSDLEYRKKAEESGLSAGEYRRIQEGNEKERLPETEGPGLAEADIPQGSQDMGTIDDSYIGNDKEESEKERP